MSILDKLSSRVGDRSESSNRKVVVQCLQDAGLLDEIAEGLKSRDAALIGDCAEVMTQVAEQHADWIAPYAGALASLINHKNTRVRWESVHALALAAAYLPETIAALLPALADLIRGDKSVIVRDYATDAIGNYAATSKYAAEEAYPLLKEALSVWGGKHAGRALKGLLNVSAMLPERHNELRAVAEEYSCSSKGVVRKAAKALSRVLDGE